MKEKLFQNYFLSLFSMELLELVKHRSLPNKVIFFEIAGDGVYEAEEVKDKKRFSLF